MERSDKRFPQQVPNFIEIVNFVYDLCIAEGRGLQNRILWRDIHLPMTRDVYLKVIYSPNNGDFCRFD